MDEDSKTFPLVLPPTLHQRLRVLAAEKNTTIRDLIIAALERVYKERAA